ncbi:MAG: helix-turn-helix domain-containing protein, partial [Paracoccus sp. (in: a-proteobacteria)]
LQPAEDRAPDQMRLAHRVAAFERDVIVATLAAHGGRLKPVYETLGLSRKSLYEKMQKYRIDKTHYVDSGDDQDG